MTFLNFFGTKTAKTIFLVILFCQMFSAQIYSQTKTTGKTPAAKNATVSAAPKIIQVDSAKLKNILKGNGKPLLVNFWATWCEPCREEFPDLVKIDADYKNKIDFITVSLDDVEELNTGVPKFLAEMKAEMPAYLLTTQDEDALISFVSKEWQGGLPFTILYDASGKASYTRMGKVKIDVLRTEIEKTLIKPVSNAASNVRIEELPLIREAYTYEKGIADAEKDIDAGKLIIQYFGFRPVAANEWKINVLLKKEYDIEIRDLGCSVPTGYGNYAKGYNEVSIGEIKRRFGGNYLEKVSAKIKK